MHLRIPRTHAFPFTATPTPYLLQLFPVGGNNCNQFSSDPPRAEPASPNLLQ